MEFCYFKFSLLLDAFDFDDRLLCKYILREPVVFSTEKYTTFFHC